MKSVIKNKKGFLLGTHTVKIVIAVLAILILIVVIVKVYSMISINSKQKSAQNTLDELKDKINRLEEGKSNEQMVVGPQGWFLMDFKTGEIDLNGKSLIPKKCEKRSCLCFCPAPSSWVGGLSLLKKDTTAKDKCQEGGICTSLNDFAIRDANFVGGGVFTLESWIGFKEIPKNLYLKKTEGVVQISKDKIDTQIMIDFLNRKTVFTDGKEISVKDLITYKATDYCSLGGDVDNYVEGAAESYLQSLMDDHKNGINGGVIRYEVTRSDKKRVSFSYNVWVGKNCEMDPGSFIEAKRVCRKDAGEEIRGGYLRIWTC
tara:strand:- start:3556 stop:4503 length:948 start_codon:yes stop_codon:yes gene_type:complete